MTLLMHLSIKALETTNNLIMNDGLGSEIELHLAKLREGLI